MTAVAKTAAPRIVNGINVDDLMALVAGVEQDAAKGKTAWQVATSWRGQTRCRAEVTGFTIGGEEVPRCFSFDIDEPHELGGGNAFANPQEHLIAALNACMTVGYVAQCAIRGITLDSLEIETEGEIDLRGGVGDVKPGEYGVTSPPVIVGDRLVTGAMVLDNRRVDMPGGVVRAFDVRSGAQLWAWDPVPPGAPPPEPVRFRPNCACAAARRSRA